jgi:hypothetical protein
VTRKDPVDALPDLGTLSDEELKELIRTLELEEAEISYQRRLLQGRIDILRAERTSRLQRSVEKGEGPIADVDRLSDILSSKGAPPAEDGT